MHARCLTRQHSIMRRLELQDHAYVFLKEVLEHFNFGCLGFSHLTNLGLIMAATENIVNKIEVLPITNLAKNK
jgi:hypothetical protein